MVTPGTVTQLTRRRVNRGYVELLTPSNVTNSKKADGGWMDTRGVTDAGLGSMFNTADPVDSYISNNAYARAGFASMHIELYPPLEVHGKPSTRENLMEYLKTATYQRENSPYKAGNFVDLNAPRIDNPADTMGSTADLIVQYWYERPCDAVGHDLPSNLKAVVNIAAVYFAGKGMVVFKADNFHNLVPTIDFTEILSSIRFVGKSPYLPRFDSPQAPRLCFRCCASKSSPEGTELLGCGRCKWVTYCSAGCQKSDWKRHKKGECLRRKNTK